MYDIAIIGAGVVGSAIARELSRYKASVLLLDREIDVGTGATKANSGIVHGGYTAKHGTLKGTLCIEGNRMYESLNKELNFGYRKTGSLVLAFDDEEMAVLEELRQNGIKNGVTGLRVITKTEALKMEPHLNAEVQAALFCPETGITSPYEFCIALAENAVSNGVELRLGAGVQNINKNGDTFHIETTQGPFSAQCVINAAGVFADSIASMVGADDFSIQPRRGQYLLFLRGTGDSINTVIFQTPTEKGKGILVTSTFWGNLMIGPDAQEVEERENLATDTESLAAIVKTARKSVPDFDLRKAIRSFSGIRATTPGKDFIIEESKVPGFVNVAGIDSPGLTSSPAIAKRVVQILREMGLSLGQREGFKPLRRPITAPSPLQPMRDIQKDVERPAGDPERIVCRCEQVREGTIVDAIHRGIPICSTDAIKRRTRAGMGACQGTFCTERVREIISRETSLASDDVALRGRGSGAFPNRVSREDLKKLVEEAAP